MDPISPEAQAELARKHKSAATTVLGLLVAVILLAIVAFVSRAYLELKPPNLSLDWATRLLVLFLGLGAIVWRRNRFSAMRLQDIAGVAGVSGLIKTLEKTTIQLALLAAAIAIIGFANEAFGEYITPSLSTVNQQTARMGQEAAKLFFDGLGKPYNSPPRKLVLHPDLVCRQSSIKIPLLTSVNGH